MQTSFGALKEVLSSMQIEKKARGNRKIKMTTARAEKYTESEKS